MSTELWRVIESVSKDKGIDREMYLLLSRYDGDKFDGTNTQIAFHQGAQSSFTNMADGGEDDMYIKIYGKAGWVERGVAV